ncbi:MAG: thiolase C-terminal domain-containing protein [Mycobacteriales bacterium]
MQRDIFVVGAALAISFGDARRNLSEMIFETVRSAVDDSGQPMAAVDSVVLAAHDLVDGRSLSSMVTAPAAGAYLRDETRYADDGAAAFAAGVMRLESGQSRRTVVAAWGRASEHNPDQFARALFDPAMTRPLGLNELVLSALRAELYLRDGSAAAARESASARRVAAAARNPRALAQGGFRSQPHYPLLPEDLPLWADVFAAVVLSGEPAAVRVTGLGQASEPYSFGDRNLRRLSALEQATARAFAESSVGPEQLDVAEVDGLTLFDEALGLEAVGLASSGQGMARLAEDPRTNPSGGGAGGYCPPSMGLARIVESVLQLRGEAGSVQIAGAARALATGSSTVAGQTATAVVLEAE